MLRQKQTIISWGCGYYAKVETRRQQTSIGRQYYPGESRNSYVRPGRTARKFESLPVK